jgi:hypothetical protein
MLRLLSDEDVPGEIIHALRQRQPDLDISRVQEVGLMHTDDSVILAWAAAQGRQVLRDRNTMTAAAWERVNQGLPMPEQYRLKSGNSPTHTLVLRPPLLPRQPVPKRRFSHAAAILAQLAGRDQSLEPAGAPRRRSGGYNLDPKCAAIR